MRVSTVWVIPLFGQAVNKKGLACCGCKGGRDLIQQTLMIPLRLELEARGFDECVLSLLSELHVCVYISPLLSINAYDVGNENRSLYDMLY